MMFGDYHFQSLFFDYASCCTKTGACDIYLGTHFLLRFFIILLEIITSGLNFSPAMLANVAQASVKSFSHRKCGQGIGRGDGNKNNAPHG